MIYLVNVQSDLANVLGENPLNVNTQYLSVFNTNYWSIWLTDAGNED